MKGLRLIQVDFTAGCFAKKDEEEVDLVERVVE
jgi:hypothetical protein